MSAACSLSMRWRSPAQLMPVGTAPPSVTDAHATNLSRDRAELRRVCLYSATCGTPLCRHGMLVACCTVERLMAEEVSRRVR